MQKQALTDTSYKNIDHSLSDDDTNAELATYGDAILKLALCKIYREYKENGLRFSENLSDWKKKYESDKVSRSAYAYHEMRLSRLSTTILGIFHQFHISSKTLSPRQGRTDMLRRFSDVAGIFPTSTLTTRRCVPLPKGMP